MCFHLWIFSKCRSTRCDSIVSGSNIPSIQFKTALAYVILEYIRISILYGQRSAFLCYRGIHSIDDQGLGELRTVYGLNDPVLVHVVVHSSSTVEEKFRLISFGISVLVLLRTSLRSPYTTVGGITKLLLLTTTTIRPLKQSD